MIFKTTHKYDDIINLPYTKSKKHEHMSPFARAAQFAPYAALTGYDELIEKTGEDVLKKFEDENKYC